MSFSDRFFEQKSGIIELYVPSNGDGSAHEYVRGVLQDDPQIQLGNNFNPISEFKTALDPLQDFQQIIQADSISSFISGSGMVWKGTNPMKVNCGFYLISFSAKSNIQKSARVLAQLGALSVAGATSVKPHCGYSPNLISSNDALGDNVNYSSLNDISGSGEKVPGTVTIVINSTSHTKLTGLLATSIQIQPSTVTVKDGAPLYYIVNMSFTGYRSPTFGDLKHTFGGK